jgi:hypothetical protein
MYGFISIFIGFLFDNKTTIRFKRSPDFLKLEN